MSRLGDGHGSRMIKTYVPDLLLDVVLPGVQHNEIFLKQNQQEQAGTSRNIKHRKILKGVFKS